ncbi:proline-rich protein 23A-like [Perognathus longimembris pacificus]|uniref:proline-rich protein 23A-like n=1 Tax=Perognathus longimembris pacificus TaxID=214514 RepID=UPI0020195A27|nr:proline-rich protein 23A-like [Perognathus longimembris pacificus]XP_048192979.1 proline-rich protein 23A-like [Perognathus longimembris pacificus]XP_048192980.1 proline-rich protein 23A-like [Perognathus longimembris pacificus]XP_048192981.1 proline-rich protein 23A-like [Perognathus longimembris pacificus]XP_048192983.1 proline-rich protein 23A-like [Perognathus longimembris pacificus]XP_048192984.1 proline-rich protein 23A-like [Perognathus longimembris pacificus]XP_048192985.1 proline-
MDASTTPCCRPETGGPSPEKLSRKNHPGPPPSLQDPSEVTPWFTPEPAGPSPAKRSRKDPPRPPPSSEDSSKATPAPADTHNALTSLVVLATGCALQVPLGHVDLVLEPPPTSVLTVDLLGHRLVLIPQDLLGPNPQGQPGTSSDGLLLDDLLDTRPEDVVVRQGLCCQPFPDVACQEEVYTEDAEDTEEAQDTEDSDPDFLEPSWSSPEPQDPSPQPGLASAHPSSKQSQHSVCIQPGLPPFEVCPRLTAEASPSVSQPAFKSDQPTKSTGVPYAPSMPCARLEMLVLRPIAFLLLLFG